MLLLFLNTLILNLIIAVLEIMNNSRFRVLSQLTVNDLNVVYELLDLLRLCIDFLIFLTLKWFLLYDLFLS